MPLLRCKLCNEIILPGQEIKADTFHPDCWEQWAEIEFNQETSCEPTFYRIPAPSGGSHPLAGE